MSKKYMFPGYSKPITRSEWISGKIEPDIILKKKERKLRTRKKKK